MAYDSNVLRRATQRLTEERERRESERDLRRAEDLSKAPPGRPDRPAAQPHYSGYHRRLPPPGGRPRPRH